MEFCHEGSISLPIGFSFDDEDEDDSLHASPRTSCVSAASSSFPVFPMSPETPWRRSPMHISPSPPLLYDCLASLHFNKGNILSIAVTKDVIFTGSSSSRVHAWKLPDGTETGYIKAPSGEIRAMLAGGKLLFTTHGDCRIRAWEISPTDNFRLKKIMSLPPRRRSSFFSFQKNHRRKLPISCLAYDNKEKLLFTGLVDQTVNVWNISEKRQTDSFIAHEGRINAIVINQDDGCVFTCSSDGTLKIWRRIFRESSHILIRVLMFQQSPINALALSLSPSVCFLYSGSSDGVLNFWEKEKISGRYNHSGYLQGHHFAILCIVTIDDLILSGSEDSTIRIWKREDGNNFIHSNLAVIDGHHGPVKCLSTVMEIEENVEGLLVCSASLDQTLKVWRVKVKCDRLEDHDEYLKTTECIMSPVLSPSWVQKKICVNDSQRDWK